MKLTKHNNSLETNIQSESQNFSIGDASVIIEILRRDAMSEVNSKKSLQIVAPTI